MVNSSQKRSFSAPQRGRRRVRPKADFQSYAVDDSEDDREPTEPAIARIGNHRHSQYSSNDSGSISTRTSYFPLPVSPQKSSVPRIRLNDDTAFIPEDMFEGMEEDLDVCDLEDISHVVDPSRKRGASDNPLMMWRSQRDAYLQCLIWLEGRGDTNPMCRQCALKPGIIRCKSCFGGDLWCQECAVDGHMQNPLHRIEEWNGSFFEATTLKALGMMIQLGHPPGVSCSNPRLARGNDFVIIDTQGIHEVMLSFCDCEHSKDFATQLLRFRLFPATDRYPNTAATFNVLNRFQLLSFESKCSAYEFYRSLARETNNTGLKAVKDRYSEFLRMVLEWRHIRMLKRAGRGHDPGGVAATTAGQCALLCPACPQEGKNLPRGWETADHQWIYALFLAIDANFRLRRKIVSSDRVDPGLSNGWAFFVEEKEYKRHLSLHWEQKQERSTCVAHDAVNKPDRESRGTAASGLGTIDCARHNMKRPNGVGDLQKGERYLNMDYMFFSSLENTKLRSLVVSYDIACQWHKNVWERMKIFPHSKQVFNGMLCIKFLVPKFHLPAHIEACNLAFSFNLTKNMGRTDGEAPERGWADANKLAGSTKEMGPGSRRDTIDDHFNDWNWKKIVTLGRAMLKKIKVAVPKHTEHVCDYHEFERALPKETIAQWKKAVELWEADNTQVNPFQSTSKAVTQQEVRLSLAENGGADPDVVVHRDTHPSVMVASGLELEQQQRRLARDISGLGDHSTSLQRVRIAERSNCLRRKIDAWMELQTLYIPGVAAIREAATRNMPVDTPELATQDIPLLLPSELRRQARCDRRIQNYEWRLREGQAHDALHSLRQELRLLSHLYKSKDRFARGVAQNTRANINIQKSRAKINATTLQYRHARQALLTLGDYLEIPRREWQQVLKVLDDADVRGMSTGLADDTEGTRTLSWIWTTVGVGADEVDDPGMNDALRIEWCRARARATRWTEEVILLQEEMRRILSFLSWEQQWWENQGSDLPFVSIEQSEGTHAYAKRQAALRGALRSSYAFAWKDVDTLVYDGIEAVARMMRGEAGATGDGSTVAQS